MLLATSNSRILPNCDNGIDDGDGCDGSGAMGDKIGKQNQFQNKRSEGEKTFQSTIVHSLNRLQCTNSV